MLKLLNPLFRFASSEENLPTLRAALLMKETNMTDLELEEVDLFLPKA